MKFAGLLILIGITLFATVACTAAVFRLIQKFEKKLPGADADERPTFWLILGQLAVGLTVSTVLLGSFAAVEVDALTNRSSAERAPIHMLVGRQGATVFQSVALICGLGLPVAMFFSVGLGSAGAVGGVLKKNRRAIVYSTASLAINGLLILALCWVVSGPSGGGDSDDPETEAVDGQARLISPSRHQTQSIFPG